MSHLLHPKFLQSLPIVGGREARALNQRIIETLADDFALDPPITVAVRAFNEAPKLELLLQDLAKQAVGHKLEIIVVDNESTDDTKKVAEKHGAKVVTLPRKQFTYPNSMNLCMEAASHDAVFITVAHAQLASTYTLHAGARHFQAGGKSKVAGVFSIPLPSSDASRTGRFFDALIGFDLLKKSRKISKASIGTMGATGAFFSKAVWQELGRFDERYKSGGEDTAMGRSMLAAGYEIVREPAMAVHHSHGLGLNATIREFLHYCKTVRGPQPFKGAVKKRRQARFSENK